MSHASHFASTCFSSPKVTGTLNVPANSGSGDAPDLSEAQPDKQCDPVITTPTEGAPAASETAHPAAPTAVGDTGDDPTPIPTEAVTDAHPSEPVSEPAGEPITEVGAGQHEPGSQQKPLPANAQMVAQAVSSFLRGMTDDNASEESRREALANFNVFRQAIKKTVEGKKSLTEKKSYVDGMYTTMLPIDTKAKVLTAVSSIMRGDAANEMKKGIPHGKLRSAIGDKFPEQRFRKLQEDMSIARLKGVERHCDLGVTILVKLAAIIKKDDALSKLSDPIQTILDKVQKDIGLLDQDYETLADIAIADFKLKKAQLVIDPAALRNFIAAGYKLESKDIKEMQAMQKVKKEALARGEDAPDPSDFLESIAESAGTRVFALTGTPTTEEEMDASPDAPPAIPEINSALVKTTETLTQALSLPEFPKKEVDRIAVRNLMEVLKRIDDATNQS